MNDSPQLRHDADQILLFHNPKAGSSSRKEKLQTLIGVLTNEGFEVLPISDLDEIGPKTTELIEKNKLYCVISAGGDGTASAVVNRTPQGTPIAIFPSGTENVFAKYLQITGEIAAFVEMITGARSATFDVGRIGDSLFLLMLGAGFDAHVVRQVHQERSGHISKFSYLKPIWRSIRRYKYPDIRVSWEDKQGEINELIGKWAFIMNVPRYAMGLSFAPDACPSDGYLDVCVLNRGGLLSGIDYFRSLIFGRIDQRADATVIQAKKITIESLSGEIPYQTDGDPHGELPIEVEVVPGRFECLVPKSFEMNDNTASEIVKKTETGG
ncbi:MAG: diacylglycerol/lipid kinase family protein [Pirellulales bacterium]